ncbi:MAG TPA: aldehyde dehydrogenase family protein [Gemmataceae bacterium]|nr:aldehyde dehydrogenase family protein [Gemmataceae bacterium]
MSPFAAEVAACRAAQQHWAALSVRERLKPVRELRHLLVERADEIYAAIAADIRRPSVEVLATELLPTTAALKYLEQDAKRLLKPRRIAGRFRPTWLLGSRDAVHRRPWGVVGIIGTWNYPVYLNAVQVAQATTAGNGVLWKPSENVPRTADLTHQLFRDAGFPTDLFVKLPATREAGPELAEADIDHVVFTGSDAVGRKLAAKLGERLVPSTLELSGCDAMFVLEDADPVRAAHAAWFGVTLNHGQTCIAVRRIFVHRSKCEAFVDVLKPLIAGAKPMSLVTAGQQSQFERVIADAVERGGTALRGDGTVTPTFLVNAAPEMAVCREASFAPVAAVIPFDNIDNALSLAAACPFALAASVFTTDTRAAEQLAPRIPAGSVTVNDVLAPTAHPATPFGGRGSSGWGVTQGAEGLLAMSTPQVVTVRRGKFRPHIDETVKPDPESTADILGGLLRATHGRGWREWFRGVRHLLRGVRRKKK